MTAIASRALAKKSSEQLQKTQYDNQIKANKNSEKNSKQVTQATMAANNNKTMSVEQKLVQLSLTDAMGNVQGITSVVKVPTQ